MVVVQNVALKAPVTLGDSSGNPKTGVTYDQVSVYIQKAGGAATVKTLTTGSQWVEVSSLGMPGVYDLQLAAGDLDTVGLFKYSVKVTGSPGFNGLLEVQAQDLGGLTTAVNSLGSTITSSSTALATNVQTSLDNFDDALTGALNTSANSISNTVNSLSTSLNQFFPMLSRMLGLVHENSVLDQTSFDDHNNLIDGRLRIYPSKNDLLQGTNVVATYRIAASYFENTSNVQEYKMTLESLGS